MRFPILLICCVGLVFQAKAQQNSILYHLHDISQSNYLNPAIAPACGWTIGIPALDNISVAAMGAVSYNDLDPGASYINTQHILSKLKNGNILSTNATVNILRVGYRKGNSYYQFSMNERAEAFGYINKAPIEIILKGNGQYIGETIKGEAKVKAIYYREYAFNYSKKIKDDLWIGIRPKVLFGRFGMESKKANVTFYTDPATYQLTLNSDVEINASMPGEVSYDNNGYVNAIRNDYKKGDFIFSPANIGAGLDFGLIKENPEGLSYSLSLLNLGFISWSKNKKNFSQQTSIVYSGVTSSIGNWDELTDTLKSIAKFRYSEDVGYTQMLSPVIMVGANYPVNNFLRAGATLMGEIQQKKLPWSATLSLYTQNLSMVTAAVSYSINTTSYVNFGLAAGLRFGAVELHMLVDNIMATAPLSAKYITAQFGINIKLCKGNKNKEELCPAYQNIKIRPK